MLKTTTALLLILFALCVAGNGEYIVSTYTENYSTGRTRSLTIFYPECFAAENGIDCKNQKLKGPYPVIVLSQGGNTPAVHYSALATYLTKNYGYVVVTPDARPTPVGPTQTLQLTSVFVLAAAAARTSVLNNDASVLDGRADPSNIFILGHSFGAFVAYIAVSSNGTAICNSNVQFGCFGWPGVFPGVQGAVNYGSSIYFQNQLSVFPNTVHPMMIIRGTNDGRVPYFQSFDSYDRFTNPPKSFVNLTGANHFGITNTQSPAGSPDNSPQTITQDQSVTAIAQLTDIFIRATIDNANSAHVHLYLNHNINVDLASVVAAQDSP